MGRKIGAQGSRILKKEGAKEKRVSSVKAYSYWRGFVSLRDERGKALVREARGRRIKIKYEGSGTPAKGGWLGLKKGNYSGAT